MPSLLGSRTILWRGPLELQHIQRSVHRSKSSSNRVGIIHTHTDFLKFCDKCVGCSKKCFNLDDHFHEQLCFIVLVTSLVVIREIYNISYNTVICLRTFSLLPFVASLSYAKSQQQFQIYYCCTFFKNHGT